jgi:hypothetical protein
MKKLLTLLSVANVHSCGKPGRLNNRNMSIKGIIIFSTHRNLWTYFVDGIERRIGSRGDKPAVSWTAKPTNSSPMPHIPGYARVSKSEDQETAPQIRALKKAARAGLREARERGRVLGRKPKITGEQKKEIIDAVASGRKSAAEMARLFKIHRATISRVVSQVRTVEKPASKP